MTLREIMTQPVIRVGPKEPVGVAARLLEHYNIGALPVCSADGQLQGMVTDRDLVTRCLASGLPPERMTVADIMTRRLVAAPPELDTSRAAQLMGDQQIRRLPVIENGRLCGMVSLGDLKGAEAAGALERISSGIAPFEGNRD